MEDYKMKTAELEKLIISMDAEKVKSVILSRIKNPGLNFIEYCFLYGISKDVVMGVLEKEDK